MNADRKGKILWRCAVASLSLTLLFLAFGSRSLAFHQWIHGADRDCVLTHQMSEHDHEVPKDHDEDDADPLLPFCQVGFLFQVEPIDLLPERSQSSDFVKSFFLSLSDKPLLCAASPRAPPILI